MPGMAKAFRPWELTTQWLFPPSVLDLVPGNHVAHFVRDLVREEIDLGPILRTYVEERGYPPYHPALMTALLLFAYTQGIYSSRKIERACVERLDFMAVTAMEKPDHCTIAKFRRRHHKALAGLFVNVLRLCQEAGLAKLGHVSIDGTKVKANASKHKAMSYERMVEVEKKLEAEVNGWLEKHESTDQDEDEKHGGKRGDELPDWVANRQARLETVRAAKARVEQQAKELAEKLAEERAAKEAELGRPLQRKGPKALDGVPDPKAQSNFTDPESRIMKARDGYEQAYNCQLTVDAESHVVVACDVVTKQNDCDELVPALEQIEANLGMLPSELSADSAYGSEANLVHLEDRGVTGYVATGRQRHGTASATDSTKIDPSLRPAAARMQARLRRGGYQSRYRLRKQTVEPVIGQAKEARGFRRFFLRGLELVTSEWALVLTAHNLLKLAKTRLDGLALAPAPA